LAMVAGVLGYLMRTLDNGEKPTWARVLIEASAAGLVGLFAMWVCESLELSQQLTAVTVGVFGWLGASASLDLIQSFIVPKVGGGRRSSDDR
ncbi:phage holin family protein, partial [Xylella fastidiosa subsp. multiplex]